MRGLELNFGNCLMRTRSAVPAVLLAAALAAGAQGCAALPALSIIPSLISLAHELSTSKSETAGTETNPPEAEVADAEPSTPPPKLTMENVCQMMAISHPDLVVVELRKDAAGAPEYRELRLVNSSDEAHWTPIVGGDTGPDGWRPAVNFLKMDFKPPLTSVIPDSGSSYLAYVPIAVDARNPNQLAQLQSAASGDAGLFSWDGRMYQYAVARTVPCLSPSS